MTASVAERIRLRLPPLWLAAAFVASGWAAVDSITRWILVYVHSPVHEDVRLTYVAAEAGLRYGWQSIYDEPTLRALSASFPPDQRNIDPVYTYVHPPLVAWLFAPFTPFPEPVAYGLWTLLSLGALVVAWRIAAPYTGLARLTLLLLTLGLWPVLLAFYFGQPTVIQIALVAAAWWLCAHDRPWPAGAVLAIATFIKPQDIALLPLALLVAGRTRTVAGWLAGCAVLGAATALALGPSGVASWWQALHMGQGNSTHTLYTLANLLGGGPLTYALWGLQGAAALFIARSRRHEIEVVFAAGILGSVAIAFHFHELDYSILVLAAWLVLRTSPPMWHRVWLLVGVLPMQMMTFATDAPHPAWNFSWPQLAWDAVWLAILVAGSLRDARLVSPARPVPAPSQVRP